MIVRQLSTCIVPLQVHVLREGDPESELWEQLLLDEPDAGPQHTTAPLLDASSPAGQREQPKDSGFGLPQFLEHVAAEAAAQLAADARQST